MDIKELPVDQKAPTDANCITLKALPDGRTKFSGRYTKNNIMHRYILGFELSSEDDALQVALDWAIQQRLSFVFIERLSID